MLDEMNGWWDRGTRIARLRKGKEIPVKLKMILRKEDMVSSSSLCSRENEREQTFLWWSSLFHSFFLSDDDDEEEEEADDDDDTIGKSCLFFGAICFSLFSPILIWITIIIMCFEGSFCSIFCSHFQSNSFPF